MVFTLYTHFCSSYIHFFTQVYFVLLKELTHQFESKARFRLFRRLFVMLRTVGTNLSLANLMPAPKTRPTVLANNGN